MLSDFEQIQNLLAKYCFATDQGTADDIAALFWEDAVVDFDGNVNAGIDEVRLGFEKWIARLRAPVENLRHLLHTPLIEIDGTTATAKAYYDADGHSKKKGRLISLRGMYCDQLEKRSDEWRFVRREVKIWRSILDHAS